MATEWSHGYVTDVQYTAGFYRETVRRFNQTILRRAVMGGLLPASLHRRLLEAE